MDVLILIVISILFGILGMIWLIYFYMNYWFNKGIPYILPIPLFGNLATLYFGRKSMPDFVMDTYNNFRSAKYYGMMDFNIPGLMLKDTEIIKDICVKNFGNSPNHRSFVNERMDPIMSRNVFSLRDDRWREVRSTLSPFFTACKMKIMFNLVSTCAKDFVDYLIEHPEFARSMEMKDTMTRYTNDVIASVAFGVDVNSMKNRENEFYTRVKELTNLSGLGRMIKFVLSKICPWFMQQMGQRFLTRDTYQFFKQIIHQNIQLRKEKGLQRSDMIDLLIKTQENNTGIEITIDDIIAQAIIFFFGGFDTASTLMGFLFYSLALNPDIQENLRQQIDSAIEKNNGKLSYQVITEMKYMEMVLNETLRMYPPIPLVDRVCRKSFTLPPAMPGYKELTVKPETIMWIPIYGIHHDPKYFPNPDKFDPDRFSDENINNITPCTFIPFGLGPRKCVGDRFFHMETKIILAYVLRKFVIKPTDKTEKIIKFNKKSFTIQSKGGLWLSFERRQQKQLNGFL